MVHVGWVILALSVGLAGGIVPVILLVRANQSLVRAVIARNPQEFTALERTAGRVPKRNVPERETEFADHPPRPLGL